MSDHQHPVIFVHGWNSYPGIWNRLAARCKTAEISYRIFDHTGMKSSGISDISESFLHYIRDIRIENDWNGPIDIVSHSLGSLIVRHLLEVMDGTEQNQTVRQVITISSSNTGSTLAELFYNERHSKEIIKELTGRFIPVRVAQAGDPVLQDARFSSQFMHNLRSAGLRSDIMYRNIITTNTQDLPGFSPWFGGKTWEVTDEGDFRLTLKGDGVVSLKESLIPGISHDVLTVPPEQAEKRLPAELFGHMHQPKNPLVIDLIIKYLTCAG